VGLAGPQAGGQATSVDKGAGQTATAAEVASQAAAAAGQAAGQAAAAAGQAEVEAIGASEAALAAGRAGTAVMTAATPAQAQAAAQSVRDATGAAAAATDAAARLVSAAQVYAVQAQVHAAIALSPQSVLGRSAPLPAAAAAAAPIGLGAPTASATALDQLAGQVNQLAAASGGAAGGAGITRTGAQSLTATLPDGSTLPIRLVGQELTGGIAAHASAQGVQVAVWSTAHPHAAAVLAELAALYGAASAQARPAGRGAGDSDAVWLAKLAGLDPSHYYLSQGQPHRYPHALTYPNGQPVPALIWTDAAGYQPTADYERALPWLGPVGEGQAFHVGEQELLTAASARGVAELAVQNPGGGTANRVDFYDPRRGQIMSMKFTQLGQIQPSTAMAHLREAATKYAPGTRIVAGRNTPPELVGEPLRGELFLYVPPQTTPIPQAILDYAESMNVRIVDSAGRRYP